MRDSFIFYKSFYDSISRIKSKELKADIYEAICELALNNNDIELSNDVGLMIMDLIKPQLLANTKKYQDGKKGGRPTKKTSGYEKGKTETRKEDLDAFIEILMESGLAKEEAIRKVEEKFRE